MTKLLFILMFTSALVSGFFNESQNDEDKTKAIENQRLCKIFTHKAEVYEKTMRDDVFAKITLESYKHRASLFCKKAEDLNTSK